MNLVRLGHYHIPDSGADAGAGSCQTALVVRVWSESMVNLVVWTHEGNSVVHTSVRVHAPSDSKSASFHLSGDCPYGR
jgi:hypothetical protein